MASHATGSSATTLDSAIIVIRRSETCLTLSNASLSPFPIAFDRAVDMLHAARVEAVFIRASTGSTRLTHAKPSLPTKLPTTRPLAVTRSILDRLVISSAGMNSRNLRMVMVPFFVYGDSLLLIGFSFTGSELPDICVSLILPCDQPDSGCFDGVIVYNKEIDYNLVILEEQ